MRQRPVTVWGIRLRGDGDDIVVEVEMEDGRFYEVIREYAANPDTISHIVEPAGIRNGRSSTLEEIPE